MESTGGKADKYSRFKKVSQVVSSFISRNNIILTNAILTPLTLLAEQVFENKVFVCPCDKPDLAAKYSLWFTFGIAAIIWIIGILVCSLNGRCADVRTSETTTGGQICTRFCELFAYVFAQTSVLPAAWVFFALMDGDYFACYYAVSACDKNTPEYVAKKSQSHIYAIVFAMMYLAAIVVFKFFARCCSSKSYMQRKYTKVYQDAEKRVLNSEIEESANQLAVDNVKAFLAIEDNKKDAFKQVSTLYLDEDTTKDGSILLSPLHAFIKSPPQVPSDKSVVLSPPQA